MLKPMLLGTALLCCSATAVAAATCTEAVELFAREYGLAATEGQGDRAAVPPTPPATTESLGTTSDRLADTQGVVKPPDVGTGVVIEPPTTVDPGMPTAPPVEPGPTTEAPPTELELDASQRARMDALLTAAREADRQGQTEQCYERLQEAQNVAQRQSG